MCGAGSVGGGCGGGALVECLVKEANGFADVGTEEVRGGSGKVSGVTVGDCSVGAGERAVEQGYAAAADNFSEVLEAKTASGHDADATARLPAKAGDSGGAGKNIGAAAGGEQVAGAGGDNVFKGGGEIRRLIESAMEGDAHGAGQFDQRAGSGNVNAAVGEQDAEGDGGSAGAFCVLDLTLHEGELFGGEVKVAKARADEHGDRDGDRVDNCGHEIDGRGEAASGEAGAEFDLIGSASLGGASSVKSFDAQLKKQRVHGRVHWKRRE